MKFKFEINYSQKCWGCDYGWVSGEIEADSAEEAEEFIFSEEFEPYDYYVDSSDYEQEDSDPIELGNDLTLTVLEDPTEAQAKATAAEIHRLQAEIRDRKKQIRELKSNV